MTPEQAAQMRQIIIDFMNGKYNDHPIVKAIEKMIYGKTPQEKAQILTNILRSRGVEVDNLRFSKEELRSWGLQV